MVWNVFMAPAGSEIYSTLVDKRERLSVDMLSQLSVPAYQEPEPIVLVHRGPLQTALCCCCPGSSIVVSGDEDGGLKVWDMRARKQVGCSKSSLQ